MLSAKDVPADGQCLNHVGNTHHTALAAELKPEKMSKSRVYLLPAVGAPDLTGSWCCLLSSDGSVSQLEARGRHRVTNLHAVSAAVKPELARCGGRVCLVPVR